MTAQVFPFRPWVRRAGLSIVLVAAAASLTITWIGERALWVYVATLWLGGLKVWLGTLRPVAVVDAERVVLRPLHNLRARVIRWADVRGTEQMIGGDRLIVYYDTPRGMRFAALNLNLVKGRREFLALIDGRLRAMGFTERIVERSRYLSRA
ncbi:MAG: hypothetical protein AABO58_02090 [Acidobacteriota bacterium]